MSVLATYPVKTSPGNVATLSSITVPSGAALVFLASVYNTSGTGVMTISDTSGSNTWTTRQNAQGASAAASIHIATCDNAAGSTYDITCTISGSTGDRYVTGHLVVIDNAPSAAYDVSASSEGSGTAASTGTTAAKSQPDAVVIALFGCADSGPLISTAGLGYTSIEFLDDASTYEPISVGHKTVSASGTESQSMTLDSSSSWAAGIVAIKQDGGAAASYPKLLSLLGVG